MQCYKKGHSKTGYFMLIIDGSASKAIVHETKHKMIK